jgi:lipoprotein-releasing system ATP-binding protein
VLKATNVSKRYPAPRGELEVLSGVSLALDRGQAASIMGPSGSGKSSLLYVLGALEPPSEGEVTLDGANPYALGERDLAAFRNRQVGFVFQDHFLLPQCTVVENVLAPTLVDRDGSGPAAHERARWLIERVGLQDRRDHRPAELSGGERQRAAIARALIRQPQLLLCDEPTGNLDRASADAVAALLLDLHARERTILIVVTHSAPLADRCEQRFELVDKRLKPRR